jgi:hypothetical protein
MGDQGCKGNVFGKHFWAFGGRNRTKCTATAFVSIAASRVEYHKPCIMGNR